MIPLGSSPSWSGTCSLGTSPCVFDPLHSPAPDNEPSLPRSLPSTVWKQRLLFNSQSLLRLSQGVWQEACSQISPAVMPGLASRICRDLTWRYRIHLFLGRGMRSVSAPDFLTSLLSSKSLESSLISSVTLVSDGRVNGGEGGQTHHISG